MTRRALDTGDGERGTASSATLRIAHVVPEWILEGDDEGKADSVAGIAATLSAAAGDRVVSTLVTTREWGQELTAPFATVTVLENRATSAEASRTVPVGLRQALDGADVAMVYDGLTPFGALASLGAIDTSTPFIVFDLGARTGAVMLRGGGLAFASAVVTQSDAALTSLNLPEHTRRLVVPPAAERATNASPGDRTGSDARPGAIGLLEALDQIVAETTDRKREGGS